MFFIDKGNVLLIWDLRAQAVKPLTALDGVLRRVYLACDGVCPTSRLVEVLRAEMNREFSPEDVDALLAPLLDRGLLIRDAQSWLALTIPLGEYSPPPKVLKRLEEVIAAMGQISLPAVKRSAPALP